MLLAFHIFKALMVKHNDVFIGGGHFGALTEVTSRKTEYIRKFT